MMQFLSDIVDQLDLAIDQLSVNDRNFDRFSLMLVDNVVVLTLHGHAQKMEHLNRLSTKYGGEHEHDPVDVKKALGQSFDNKARLAKKTGLIDDKTYLTLLNLHSFRNTAYHQGLRHDGILHSLTHFYFENACEILSKFSPMIWSTSSRDIISHRARKYIGKPNFLSSKEVFKNAFKRLKEVSNNMQRNLLSDLYSDMSETIDSVESDITFLVENAPDIDDRDQLILDVQSWNFSFTDEAKEFAKTKNCPDMNMLQFSKWLQSNYKWPISGDPIPSWKRRLSSLKKEEDQHKALKRYCDFMNQSEKIRSLIKEASIQLDGNIQEQIDHLRGK